MVQWCSVSYYCECEIFVNIGVKVTESDAATELWQMTSMIALLAD